ncbi:hypothetical protein QR680_015004 [Steinernema hermaphroditum]|uniref:CWH43-like N-terminal domain-containing protein n=1 Tax=Steinernema hermaphroditum TaxID=289476 RepID=A0AA39M570_9BILA|nr:hypothetical protein QR680_015004 [Steinernema hermaphroditum]
MVYIQIVDDDLIQKKPSKSTLNIYPIPLFVGHLQHFYHVRGEKPRIYISIRNATAFCCSLPLLALILCVSSSLYYDFYKVTKTHCLVYNVLPSISAAIGDSDTGRSVWRAFIFVHILPRYLACLAYGFYFYNSSYFPHKRRIYTCVVIASTALHFFELNSLLVLTIFTSNEHHGLHVFGFSSFQVCALVHMFLHLILYKHSGRSLSGKLERYSYRLKKSCFLSSILLLIICTYLYYRHNAYCEPYVFSAFSFFEYLLVVANVMFHSTIRFDLYEQYMVVG